MIWPTLCLRNGGKTITLQQQRTQRQPPCMVDWSREHKHSSCLLCICASRLILFLELLRSAVLVLGVKSLGFKDCMQVARCNRLMCARLLLMSFVCFGKHKLMCLWHPVLGSRDPCMQVCTSSSGRWCSWPVLMSDSHVHVNIRLSLCQDSVPDSVHCAHLVCTWGQPTCDKCLVSGGCTFCRSTLKWSCSQQARGH